MGITVSYGTYVARIKEDGSVHLPIEDLPVPLPEFRRELRRAARAAKVRVLTSAEGAYFIAWDPAYEVSEAKMRAISDAMSLHFAAHPRCPECRTVLRDVPKGYECKKCRLTFLPNFSGSE